MPGAEAEDLELALAAVRRAGDIALSYFRKNPVWHRKADATPVCEADLAVDAALRDMLLGARPDYGWLSEETKDDPARLTRRRVWILDPVDGTRAYLKGEDVWCVSLALVEDGRPLIGLINAPALGRLWRAVRGGGAFDNDRPVRVSARDDLDGARIIGPAFLTDPSRWTQPWPRSIEVFRLPSLALRLAWVASGRADAMFAPGRKSEWDLAAGDLIVSEAGGLVTDAAGAPLRYNRADPHPFGVIAAPEALHGEIARRVKGMKPPKRKKRPNRT